jgi:tyrosyl-DNA phosphodiesterase 2
MEVEGENKEPLDAVMVWSVTFRIPAEPDRSGFRWALGTMDLVTCHLPAPTREAGVRGVERRLQAKMLLQRCRFPTHGNVVIGGDLSWDEDLDGPFPLEHGWLDAWKALKPPYVSGWTLDADANPMLRPCSGRKRPDRFLCKLGSRFFLESVEMVGTEVISGVEYCDDGGDSFDVLPSNHFGLLLTLSLRRNC